MVKSIYLRTTFQIGVDLGLSKHTATAAVWKSVAQIHHFSQQQYMAAVTMSSEMSFGKKHRQVDC